MLFIQGAHVRRAHGTFEFFSALTHTAAHLDCSCETALRAEIQGGRRYPRLILRMNLERFGHGRSFDNFSGVEPILGIEGALDLTECLVESRAEEFFIEVAARQAIAVLTRH